MIGKKFVFEQTTGYKQLQSALKLNVKFKCRNKQNFDQKEILQK